MTEETFEQWHSARRHELRTRYGNEHLGAIKAEEYSAWLRAEYAAEMERRPDSASDQREGT